MTLGRTIVFPLYPEVTQLDFTGPFEVLRRVPGAECVLASLEGGTLELGQGLTFANLARLSEIPACWMLCVPGGFGCVPMLDSQQYLAELRRLGSSAEFVTSVCTGSLLLAAAGLLSGKRAASHWAWRDLLRDFGVVPDSARVVRDGNVITGGGVTAGIDLALAVAGDVCGRDFAEAVELALEYAPEPPFQCGRPELARSEVVASVLKRLEPLRETRERAVRDAARELAKSPASAEFEGAAAGNVLVAAPVRPPPQL